MVNKNSKVLAFVPHIQQVHNYGASNSMSLRCTHHNNHTCFLCHSNTLGKFWKLKSTHRSRYDDKKTGKWHEGDLTEQRGLGTWARTPTAFVLFRSSSRLRAAPKATHTQRCGGTDWEIERQRHRERHTERQRGGETHLILPVRHN